MRLPYNRPALSAVNIPAQGRIQLPPTLPRDPVTVGVHRHRDGVVAELLLDVGRALVGH